MKQILLMRHGRTLWNEEKRYQGQLNSPLSTKGVEQILSQKTKIASFNIDKVYVSPLGRTLQTLKLLELNEPTISLEKDLMECHLGILQGKVSKELNFEEQKKQSLFWTDPPSYTIPQGESFYDVEKRVTLFLNKLFQSESQQPLIISHTVIIKMLLKIFLKKDMDQLWDEPHLFPGTIIDIGITGENYSINQIIHPPEAGEPVNYSV